MKRLLPLMVVVACGCSQAVDQRTSATGSEGSEAPVPQTVAAEWAANQGGQTAAAFPSSTPPTDKASTTPDKYWVKLEMLDKAHGAEGHGAAEHVSTPEFKEGTPTAPTHAEAEHVEGGHAEGEHSEAEHSEAEHSEAGH